MELKQKTKEELERLFNQYAEEYKAYKAKNISLDLTRGKPSSEQLALSEAMENVLENQFQSDSGVDIRNYGGLDGLQEAKELFAPVLGVSSEEIIIGGNSSLTLMYQYVSMAHFLGVAGPGTAWSQEGNVKFICPVPGYDRHFTICEYLGIEMIAVPYTEEGLDFDTITDLVKNDTSIKGIWCVPKYSNPTGLTYSSDQVKKLAELPKVAGKNFRILWDNAYAMHDLDETVAVDCLLEHAKNVGTEDNVVMFASTSKISFAGSGICFMSSSQSNLDVFRKHLSVLTIGPDKINQLRHIKFFGDINGIKEHMKKHAEILKPKFEMVLSKLNELGELGIGSWLEAKGGYFVSFDTLEGLATKVIALCKESGVKLTPAGSTFPYKKDPNDTNIRIAPSFPDIPSIEEAMNIFVCCVKLASVEKLLDEK